jgi:O-antigen/teichoic acid export membrane protein
MKNWKHPLVTRFLRNVGTVFVFKALSLLLTLVIYVLCAREFGAAGWGQTAIVNTWAGLMLIPLTFGLFHGVVKEVPVSKPEESRELMGTALVSTLAISVFLAILLAVSAPLIEQILGYPRLHWYWAIGSALSICWYIVSESFLRGRQMFYQIGLFKLFAAVVLLVGSLYMIYVMDIRSLESFILPFAAGNILFFVLTLASSRLGPIRVSREAWKKLFGFGAFQMLTWLFSTILFNSDLLLVAQFGTDSETGLYAVYQNNVRMLCTILFHDVFAVVFLPMIAKMDKQQIDRQIVRYCIPIGGAIFVGSFVMTICLVLLFGKTFPLVWTYVLLTAAGVTLNMLYLLMTAVISLDGTSAARLALRSLILPLPVLLALQYVAIAYWGIQGGMVYVILLNSVLIVSFRLSVRRWRAFPTASVKGV